MRLKGKKDSEKEERYAKKWAKREKVSVVLVKKFVLSSIKY